MSAPIIAYIRVSTDKQGTSGLGLEAQRKAVAQFAANEAFRVDDRKTGKLMGGEDQ